MEHKHLHRKEFIYHGFKTTPISDDLFLHKDVDNQDAEGNG